ncbi:MAG: YfhO family protein, partial [Oscillospiraceae bacterium]|nr:YfhO family protein [Oscillospiraceae bacterium]
MNTNNQKKVGIQSTDLLYYALPPLLTIAVLLIVYIIKGVYPFGNSNISYYDMNIQYIPLYARNYEIFHGSDSLIFDWLTAAGMDMTGSYAGYTLYPVNWILFFIKPDHIVNFMALFLLIKLLISSVTISLYIRRVYKVDLSMHIALCMIYVFSAYVAQQYMNIFFLDSMMTFPLLMLAFRRLYKKGNGIPYLLMLTLQMIGNGYLGYMTLLYLLFYSFGLLYTMQDMNKRRILSARVGIYTFASIFLSGITFVPGLLRTASSSRVDDFTSFSLLNVFTAHKPEEYFLNQKLFLLLNLELALALLFIILFRRIVSKEAMSAGTALRVFLFVLMLVPIFNESALLLWHLTSYSHFPYRHGYILVFSAI